MILIKLFLILVLTGGFFLFAFSSKLKTVQKLSVISGYLILLLFIAFPHYSDKVAHFFSIKSGTDLVIYIVVPLTALVNIVLFIGLKSGNTAITRIVREEAKRDAKLCK